MMHDEPEEQPGEKLFRVKIVAEVTLEIPLKLRNRVDAMEAAEKAIKAQLQCYDKDAEVVGNSVIVQEDKETSS